MRSTPAAWSPSFGLIVQALVFVSRFFFSLCAIIDY
jgi:hypothetical protein